MKNNSSLTTAKYGEWMASLFGACIIAFVLGVWLHEYFSPYAWIIVAIGVGLHSYGMFKMYKRNQ
jgi:hypothetical protein